MESLFCCPICGEGLRREPGRYACPGGHSFDVAKEGYVNLLPANRQHSKAPGDDKEMAAARSRFLEGGWYGPLRETLCALVEKYAPQAPALLDAGCGGIPRLWPRRFPGKEGGRRGWIFPSPPLRRRPGGAPMGRSLWPRCIICLWGMGRWIF